MMTLKLNELLKDLRQDRNMTLEELAEKSRISVERLKQYEAGEQIPSMPTILKLSNALEVPVTNLTDGLR